MKFALGIDVGNFQVKTSEGVIFGSKVTTEKAFNSNAKSITYNDITYYLAEGEFEIEARKFDKENFIPLLLGAIAQSTEDEIIDLAIGLPIIQFKNKNNVNELIDLLKNKEFLFRFNKEKRDRLLYISSVQVFPEGISGFLYMLSRDHELRDAVGRRDAVIVDVGGKTIDIALIKDKRATNPTSINIGTIDIYDCIMKALQEKYYDAKIEKEKIQHYLDHGFYYKGEKQDISFAIDKTKELFKKVYAELKLNYPISTEAVVVIGGGAALLGAAFKRNIPGIIVRENIDEDIFCNAKGYKALMK